MDLRYFIEFLFAVLLEIFALVKIVRVVRGKSNLTLLNICIILISVSFGSIPLVIIILNGNLMDYSPQIVFEAYLGIILFIIGLYLIDKTYPLINKKSSRNLFYLVELFESINIREVLFWYIAILFIRFILAVNYGIFFSGTENEETLRNLPYIISSLSSLLETISYGCILWAFISLFQSKIKKNKRLSSLIIIIEIFYAFVNGRRSMLFILALAIFAYFICRRKLNYKIGLFMAVLILLLNEILFPYFLEFRKAYYSGYSSGTVYNDISFALGNTSLSSGNQDYLENLSTRGYIIRWGMDILSKIDFSNSLKGKALGYCILISIPSVFFGSKTLLLDPEVLINQYVGIPDPDSPSYWAAYGFVDFGLVGGFIYGIILGILLLVSQEFAFKIKLRYPFISFIIIAAFFRLLVFVEESPIFYFTVLRNGLLLMVLYLIFFRFVFYREKRAINESTSS